MAGERVHTRTRAMSILHVYDNKGLFNDHPHGYNPRYYESVFDPSEDADRVVFKAIISGYDLRGNWVSGRPRTVVPGEFVIVEPKAPKQPKK